ncbi:MAG TPA: magnesium-translocating P-type ATPase [Albitalea sp.]|nr:magnesium-translocating P-type ATPase [Albitalea sp.]
MPPRPPPRSHRGTTPSPWWSASLAQLQAALHGTPQGLTRRQAAARLRRDGPNRLRPAAGSSLARRIVARLLDPLTLVLIAASLISALTGDRVSFGFVAVIVVMSVTLDLLQEHRAGRAVQALQHSVALRVRAWRDGVCVELPAQELVVGDCVELTAGSLVPADGRLLQATDFFVDQAALTGEAYPVEKHARDGGGNPAEALDCDHAVFMGSSVVSGAARLLVCATGARTELGRLAHTLAQDPPPTAFERGTRRFGLLLTRATMALVLIVLLVNTLYHRPLLESFLFAVALAVGLTPELLPMIVSVTLASGAVRMARKQVIVKRLAAVQDLGAMDVLCTDKTGTLTEAQLRVERVLDAGGADNDRVFELAWLNARFETGLKAPLDDAILAHRSIDASAWRKLDEVPFDFERRRVSVLLERDGAQLLIVKGAPEDIVRLSVAVDTPAGIVPMDDAARSHITRLFDECSAQGLRLLAVASRRIADEDADVSAADEHDFVFAGFVAFADPPKLSTAEALRSLQAHGVALKIVTGDNEAVTRHLCGVLGLPVDGVLAGAQIATMDDRALRAAVARANLFCRVTPEQKNRIVRALQADGHVVGYLGDGINDAPPLHSADVGISVDAAVDVAKQAADLVLLQHDLAVLRDGVREGRRTQLNVTKYVLMATSSNFGNMASMAAAALFLPFLPMRPLQILLNNFLYDLSELAIPTDRVADADLLAPRRWDLAYIRNFMLCFGPLSSLFDLLTFAVLYLVIKTTPAMFQTAWFVESMATQVLVIFVIRTARSAWRDRPSPWLAAGSLAIVAVAVALPFVPSAALFGFVPLPMPVLAWMAALTLAYLASAEVAKHLFHRLTQRNTRGATLPSIDSEGMPSCAPSPVVQKDRS